MPLFLPPLLVQKDGVDQRRVLIENFKGSGLVVTPDPGTEPLATIHAVFGDFYQAASSDGNSATSSNTYQQKLRLTTPSVEAGNYLISWHALIETGSANKNFRAQCQVDDATTLSEIEYRNAIADHQFNFAGFSVVALTAAAHDIDIDWSSLVGSSTTISRARLAIWRVS
jgi:hypothetical protein